MSDLAAASHVQYGTKPFKAILFSLFLAGFASFSTLYCVQPMMPILADFFTVTPTQSSFPLSFSTVALAIGLLFTGFISDRFGRKPIMVLALFLAAILLILSALLPIWSFFLTTRIFIGIAVSGVAAVAMTYIGEEIRQQDIGFAMGLYISGTAIGGMGGRLIAGVLVDFISWQAATLIIGGLNLLIAITFYMLLPASKNFTAYPIRFSRFRDAFVANLADRKLRILFLQGFLLMGCFVSIFNYISYYLLAKPFELSQVWIGVISIAYLAGIYSSPRAASWGNRIGRERVLPMVIVLMLIALWLMSIAHLAVVLAALVLFTFAFFAAHSTASSWVSIQALQYRAVGSSLYLFSYYMGSSLLGSGSGLIWEQWGWSGLTWVMTAVLGVALYGAWRLKIKPTALR